MWAKSLCVSLSFWVRDTVAKMKVPIGCFALSLSLARTHAEFTVCLLLFTWKFNWVVVNFSRGIVDFGFFSLRFVRARGRDGEMKERNIVRKNLRPERERGEREVEYEDWITHACKQEKGRKE